MPLDKKAEPATKPKRASRAASADKSPPRATRRSTRAASADKSPPPPTSRRQSMALLKITEESQEKSTPTKATDDVPTAGTPKRRGRTSLNPTQAAVASPVRVTRRSVAALAEEVPDVSSPRRKSRASINPSVAASSARVTRNSIAVLAAEEETETQPGTASTRSRRKSILPKGKLEAYNEVDAQNGDPLPSIEKIEEASDSMPSSIETSEEVESLTKPSQSTDETPETNSIRSGRNTPLGSADDDDTRRTPETKIPIRRTPSGSGNSEYRTPTRSQGGSRPSTPVTRNSPRNVHDLRASTKPSPDRHVNCSSRDSSPILSRDLKRNSFPSPVRHSPRSSPSRQARLSSGGSRDASPKLSSGPKPNSPLVSERSASPIEAKNNSPKSAPRLGNAAKVKETSMPEKHCLDDEEDTVMMPNKRIKRDMANKEVGSSSKVETTQTKHSPEKIDSSPKQKVEGPDGGSMEGQHRENDTLNCDSAVVTWLAGESPDNDSPPEINSVSVAGSRDDSASSSENLEVLGLRVEDNENGVDSDEQGQLEQTVVFSDSLESEIKDGPNFDRAGVDEPPVSEQNSDVSHDKRDAVVISHDSAEGSNETAATIEPIVSLSCESKANGSSDEGEAVCVNQSITEVSTSETPCIEISFDIRSVDHEPGEHIPSDEAVAAVGANSSPGHSNGDVLNAKTPAIKESLDASSNKPETGIVITTGETEAPACKTPVECDSSNDPNGVTEVIEGSSSITSIEPKSGEVLTSNVPNEEGFINESLNAPPVDSKSKVAVKESFNSANVETPATIEPLDVSASESREVSVNPESPVVDNSSESVVQETPAPSDSLDDSASESRKEVVNQKSPVAGSSSESVVQETPATSDSLDDSASESRKEVVNQKSPVVDNSSESVVQETPAPSESLDVSASESRKEVVNPESPVVDNSSESVVQETPATSDSLDDSASESRKEVVNQKSPVAGGSSESVVQETPATSDSLDDSASESRKEVVNQKSPVVDNSSESVVQETPAPSESLDVSASESRKEVVNPESPVAGSSSESVVQETPAPSDSLDDSASESRKEVVNQKSPVAGSSSESVVQETPATSDSLDDSASESRKEVVNQKSPVAGSSSESVVQETPAPSDSLDDSASESRKEVVNQKSPVAGSSSESVVQETPAPSDSLDDSASESRKEVVNQKSPVAGSSSESVVQETPATSESFDVSASNSEEGRNNCDQDHESLSNQSPDVPNEKTPDMKEQSDLSSAKSDVHSESDIKKSAMEHTLVDEGYSETSDSDYHSSGVGASDKGVNVPSILEGLGLKNAEQDVSATAVHASPGGLVARSTAILENIVEEDEVACEDRLLESKTACDDDLVSNKTNDLDKTVCETADMPSVASPLRLAVSPEPACNGEDDYVLVDEAESPTKSSSGAVEQNKHWGEIDTSTTLGKLGLKKFEAFISKMKSREENAEGAPAERDECSTETCAVSALDSDEEKTNDAASGQIETPQEQEASKEPQEESGPEIYENDTDSQEDAGEGPVKGSDFIDDEAEEGEETEGDLEDDEIISVGSDSADSDVELLDQSCFVHTEGEEAKLDEKKPSNDNGDDAENTPEVFDKLGKVVHCDESCYIFEDEEESPESEDISKNVLQSKTSPPVDKPVFEVSELPSGSAAGKTKEFASCAASLFVTETEKTVKAGESLKSKGLYASTAASQFVISETASGSHEKSGSSATATSSDQEQENTKMVLKNKKRPPAQVVAGSLKDKKFKMDTNGRAFHVKLCNLHRGTTIGELKGALIQAGIATGLLSLDFCPKIIKNKKMAVAAYDSKKSVEKALAAYGNVQVRGRSVFILLDDGKTPVVQAQPQLTAAPKKSPRKKFVGLIGGLSKDITIGDIVSAYEAKGIRYLKKVKIYKLRSSEDDLNFAKIEFTRNSALIKAVIVTENIRIKGQKICLKMKEKPPTS